MTNAHLNHIVHRNVVGGSSMVGFPLVIADSERDMQGIKTRPLTSALTNELEEVRQQSKSKNYRLQ